MKKTFIKNSFLAMPTNNILSKISEDIAMKICGNPKFVEMLSIPGVKTKIEVKDNIIHIGLEYDPYWDVVYPED